MSSSEFFVRTKYGTYLEHHTLVWAFLNEKPVIFQCENYYIYNQNQGIWENVTLDALTTQVAIYCNEIEANSWEVEYRNKVMEELKVSLATNKYVSKSTDNLLCLSNGILDILTGER